MKVQKKDFDNYCCFATRLDKEPHMFMDASHHVSMLDALQTKLPLKNRVIMFDKTQDGRTQAAIAPCEQGHIHVATHPGLTTIDMLNLVSALAHAVALCLDGSTVMPDNFRMNHLLKRIDDVCNALASEFDWIANALNKQWSPAMQYMYIDEDVKYIQQLVTPAPGASKTEQPAAAPESHLRAFDQEQPMAETVQRTMAAQAMIRAAMGFTLTGGPGAYDMSDKN